MIERMIVETISRKTGILIDKTDTGTLSEIIGHI